MEWRRVRRRVGGGGGGGGHWVEVAEGRGWAPETRRSMNKRASGIEGEGDPLRQWDCEWEKLLSLGVRPGLPPP